MHYCFSLCCSLIKVAQTDYEAESLLELLSSKYPKSLFIKWREIKQTITYIEREGEVLERRKLQEIFLDRKEITQICEWTRKGSSNQVHEWIVNKRTKLRKIENGSKTRLRKYKRKRFKTDLGYFLPGKTNGAPIAFCLLMISLHSHKRSKAKRRLTKNFKKVLNTSKVRKALNLNQIQKVAEDVLGEKVVKKRKNRIEGIRKASAFNPFFQKNREKWKSKEETVKEAEEEEFQNSKVLAIEDLSSSSDTRESEIDEYRNLEDLDTIKEKSLLLNPELMKQMQKEEKKKKKLEKKLKKKKNVVVSDGIYLSPLKTSGVFAKSQKEEQGRNNELQNNPLYSSTPEKFSLKRTNSLPKLQKNQNKFRRSMTMAIMVKNENKIEEKKLIPDNSLQPPVAEIQEDKFESEKTLKGSSKKPYEYNSESVDNPKKYQTISITSDQVKPADTTELKVENIKLEVHQTPIVKEEEVVSSPQTQNMVQFNPQYQNYQIIPPQPLPAQQYYHYQARQQKYTYAVQNKNLRFNQNSPFQHTGVIPEVGESLEQTGRKKSPVKKKVKKKKKIRKKKKKSYKTDFGRTGLKSGKRTKKRRKKKKNTSKPQVAKEKKSFISPNQIDRAMDKTLRIPRKDILMAVNFLNYRKLDPFFFDSFPLMLPTKFIYGYAKGFFKNYEGVLYPMTVDEVEEQELKKEIEKMRKMEAKKNRRKDKVKKKFENVQKMNNSPYVNSLIQQIGESKFQNKYGYDEEKEQGGFSSKNSRMMLKKMKEDISLDSNEISQYLESEERTTPSVMSKLDDLQEKEPEKDFPIYLLVKKFRKDNYLEVQSLTNKGEVRKGQYYTIWHSFVQILPNFDIIDGFMKEFQNWDTVDKIEEEIKEFQKLEIMEDLIIVDSIDSGRYKFMDGNDLVEKIGEQGVEELNKRVAESEKSEAESILKRFESFQEGGGGVKKLDIGIEESDQEDENEGEDEEEENGKVV